MKRKSLNVPKLKQNLLEDKKVTNLYSKLKKNLSLIGLFALFKFSPFSFGERLDFLIPAGPGGGLDSTARAIGDSLLKVNPSMKIRYENRTGGGGGKAMSYFVNSKASFQNTLLVNSTPLLIGPGCITVIFLDIELRRSLVRPYILLYSLIDGKKEVS